jgi:hypothetical protein
MFTIEQNDLNCLQKERRLMKKKKEDRRVERTRKLLHEALPALILEKGYEAVTVQDILDRPTSGDRLFIPITATRMLCC